MSGYNVNFFHIQYIVTFFSFFRISPIPSSKDNTRWNFRRPRVSRHSGSISTLFIGLSLGHSFHHAVEAEAAGLIRGGGIRGSSAATERQTTEGCQAVYMRGPDPVDVVA